MLEKFQKNKKFPFISPLLHKNNFVREFKEKAETFGKEKTCVTAKDLLLK